MNRLSQPSGTLLFPGAADSMIVLGVKVRSGVAGGPGSMNDRQVALVVNGLERAESGMQREESIQVDGAIVGGS